MDEDHDQEPEEPIQAEPVVKNVPEVSSAPKETERQLSKKERKKKELAELEALLADFGVSPKVDSTQDESHGNYLMSYLPHERFINLCCFLARATLVTQIRIFGYPFNFS